jgi:Cys-tRNA(Pro)/Cys-tRNA(Cys) deacylase
MGKDKHGTGKDKVAVAKTNVARLLDKAKIVYELIPYEVDENNLAATHVAEELGEDVECVFKTLVLKGEFPGRNAANSNAAGYFVCVVPGDAEVDLKKAAKAAGAKKADLIPMKDLLPLTGYIRGGCCPIGMKKPFPTFFHTTALDFEQIYVSAGQRGLQLKINPRELIAFVGAETVDLL